MATSPEAPENPREARPTMSMLWLYVFGFVACAALIILLPVPYSLVVLLFLVLGSLVWGVYRLTRDLSAPPLTAAARPRRSIRLARPRIRVTRNHGAAVFALLGFALMIAAALDLRPLNHQTLLDYGAAKMIAGALAIGGAIRLSKRLPALNEPLDVPLDRQRRFWRLLVGVGTLLLAIAAEINGQMLHIPALREVPTTLQYALLMSGVLLVGYGFGGAPSLVPRLRGLRIKWSTVLPLCAILALALFLRLWDQTGSLRYLMDELHYSDAVLGLEGRSAQQILTPMSGQATDPWIYPFWVSGAVAVIGHNWIGFRFVSAIIGVLTVLATYGLATAIFDRKTALLGALVLATFPPHIHFSRITQSLITDPLFGTMALMFVARALRNNRRIEWAMAGVSLGLTQYFYEGGRLLFPPLMTGFVIFLALTGKMRGKWRGLLIMLATAVIISAPIYYTLIGNGKPLFGRYDVSGVGTSYWQQFFTGDMTLEKVSSMVQHVLSSFMMFGAHEDMSVFYGGEQALILDYLLPFFLFGIFYLLWRYPASVFLIPIWVVATGIGNGLLRDTLASTRYYVVVPALALAIAAGVRYLLPFFWNDPQPNADGVTRREPLLRRTLTVVAIGAIAAAQVGYYFGPHLQFANVQVRVAKGFRDGIDAVSRALDLPGNTQIYLIGRPIHDQNVVRNWLGFLTQDGNPTRFYPVLAVSPDTISPKFLFDLPSGVNYAFYVDPTAENVLQLLYRYFPGISPAQYSPWNVPAFKEYVLFFVPSASIPSRPPLKYESRAQP